MRVVIIGGSGFIGRALTRSLTGDGHSVVIVSRGGAGRTAQGNVSFAPFDGHSGQGWAERCDGADALVNLAGENISTGYWTKAKKRRILQSRVDAGRAVMDALGRLSHPPAVLVQASAVGYYGDRGDAPTDEDAPRGTGFLAEVAGAWEASTVGAQALGMRRVVVRTSIVLGAGGGALPSLIAPYRFFLGGPLGSGRQWFSWIHLVDEVRAIRFLMDRDEASGPYNLAAPGAVTQNELAAAIGKALFRPAIFRVPEPVLRLAMGEMAQELLLNGARLIPRRLTELGFAFRFSTLTAALADILGGTDARDARDARDA